MEKGEFQNLEDRLKTKQETTQSPVLFEALGEQMGVRTAIEALPAEDSSVTGDFFRITRLSDGRLSIFLGDVEGHGQRAAEITLELHNFMATPSFQQAYTSEVQAADILRYIDQNRAPSELSVTLAHVLLNLETKQLQYANAGMPSLYVVKRSGEISEIRASGLYVGSGYSSHNSGTAFAELSPGDTIILVSDGVAGAITKAGSKMNLTRLLQEISRATTSPKEFTQRIISELASPRKDDATVLIFQLTQ